ncbi:AAA family ATPase [Streptosporangium sp. OZ121]|uniref:AAA family ATPase n=1 Tax=Streptosporangium sp. OZ121 TaxID=3444183 RepID=UPI003F792401
MIAASGPAAGVVAGGLTNLLTTTWNWWLFGGLVMMTTLVSAGALITLPQSGDPQAASTAEEQSQGSMLQPPTGTRVFIGRGKELSRLTAPAPDGNHPGPRLLVITGMPGTGKTELAIRAAHELAARYPDGVFWLGLRTYAASESRMTSTEALRTLLNALRVPPNPKAADVTTLGHAWQAATRGKRLLVVLDDADTTEHVRPLLPAAEGSAVLITTRHVLIGLDPDHTITPQPFSHSQAAQLAGAILRRAGLNDPRAAAEIAAAFRLPLSIRQMSDLKAANPARDILATPVELIEDETAAAFARSFAALAKPARSVLRSIARYPGSSITTSIAAVIADRSSKEAAALMSTLYRRGLLIVDDSGRGAYRMHDAVRAAALIESDKRDTHRRQAAADERLFRYTAEAIRAATLLVDSSASVAEVKTGRREPRVPPPRHESNVAALRWLDRHHADLLAVTRRCLSIDSPQAWRLAHSLEAYQRMRGFYAEIVELNSQALSLAERMNDRLGQAAMHHNLGLVDMRTSKYSAALTRFRTSLALYSEVGSQAGQMEIHHELCNVNKWLGNFNEARLHAEFCLEAASLIDGFVELAFAHSSLGILDRLEGHAARSREHLTRAMELFEQAGHRRGQGICHRQLGMLDGQLNKHGDAQAHLDQALILFRELGDLMSQADTHHNLAVVHRHLGAPATAHQNAVTALLLSRQVGHIEGQADAYVELATQAQAIGNHMTAHANLRQAEDLRQSLPSRQPGPYR